CSGAPSCSLCCGISDKTWAAHLQSPAKMPEDLSERTSWDCWPFPDEVAQKYREMGIERLLPWQAECLGLPGVLDGASNLVYSAPTSAGKTLVAELLMLRRLLQDGGGSGAETGGCRKALLVLPYVSVSREKADSLRRLFSTMGLRVGGFFGGQAPAGGLASVDAAVCTLEKANSLANRLLEEGRLDLLAAVVVDELHLIGDESRGYLLELFLTKLLFLTRRPGAPSCQVIGMSATLPGLEKLASWLGGRLYSTDYRPVPLCQMAKIGRQLLDTRLSPLGPPDSGEGGPVGALAKPDLPGDSDQVGALCLDTVLRGHSVLVFCPTKAWCEQLADSLARIFFGLIKREGSPEGDGLRATLDYQALLEVRSQLQASPAGLDPVLGRTVPFACAFHHAGLTSEEREVLESGFRRHAIRVLVATSTLSAGVNLPARLVIVRTPTFYGRPLDPFVYRQMVGRAGRLGVDTRGESILICQPQERRVAMELLGESPLRPLASCLPTRSLRRAVLEAVASGVAQTRPEVESYIGCSLAASTGLSVLEQVADTLQQLLACDLLVRRPDDSLAATNLGCAVLASALGPDEGLQVLTELENARRGLALDTELHLVYLCTPVYCDVSGGSGPDWLLYTDLLHSLPPAEKRVAGLVGVSERYIGRRVRQLGAIGRKDEAERLDRLHRRFYTALALADLVAERGLAATSQRFRANRGQLQSLQQQAGSYAAMVTVFAARLGWSPLDQLLAQFQSRLCFGVQADLLQLIRLPLLDATRARALHRAGLRTVSEVAAARPAELERLLRQAAPFRTRREAAEADADGADEEAGRVILDAAGRPLSELEAAETIVTAAKQLLRDDLAALGVVWNPEKAGDSSKEAQPAKPWRRPGRQSVLVDGDDFIASQAESEPLDGGGVDGEGGDGGGSAAPAAEGADVSADIEAEQAEMSQFLDSVCSQRLLASQTAAPPAASQLPESPTSIGDEGQADEFNSCENSPEPAFVSANSSASDAQGGLAAHAPEIADDASKPTVDGSKPAVDGSKPTVDASKPAVGASKPAVGASKPVVDASKPTNDASKPAVDRSKPTVNGSKPAVDASKPANDASKPAVDKSKPTVNGSKLNNDASKPANDASKPANDASKPANDASKPANDASKPANDASKPANDASKPANDASKPTVNGSKPAAQEPEPTSKSNLDAVATRPVAADSEGADASVGSSIAGTGSSGKKRQPPLNLHLRALSRRRRDAEPVRKSSRLLDARPSETSSGGAGASRTRKSPRVLVEESPETLAEKLITSAGTPEATSMSPSSLDRQLSGTCSAKLPVSTKVPKESAATKPSRLLLVEQSPESPAAVVDPGTTPETAGTPKSSRVLVEESPDTDAVTMPTKVAVCTPTVLVEQSPDASDSAGSSKAPADKSLELSVAESPEVEVPVPIEPEAAVPAPTKPEAPVPAPTKPEVPVAVPIEPEVPVPAPTKPEAPVPAPTKPEAPVPAPTKPEAPVPAPTKPEVPVPAPTKPEVPVAVPTSGAPMFKLPESRQKPETAAAPSKPPQGLDWPDDSFVVNSQLARLCDIGLTGQPIVRQPPETAADNPADCSDADDPCATEEGSFVVMDANAQALNVLGDTITESMLAAIDENSVVKRAAADRQGPPQPSTPVVASSPSTPRSILKASASAAASPAALLLSRKRPLANNSADASADGEVDETSDAEMAPTPSRKRVRFADLSFPDVEDAGLEKDADSSDAAVGAAPSLTPTKPALPFAVKPVTCSEAELSAFMRDTLAVKEFAFALAFEPLDPTANRDENGRPRVIRADDDPELRLSWPAGRVRCVGVALCLSESTVHYLDLTGRAVPLRQCLSLLRRKLALAKSLACFHCRRQWAAMARCLGYQLEPGCLVDPGVAAWMLDPAGKSHGITAVASRFAPGELQYLEATHRRLGAVGRRRAVAEAHAAFVLTPRLLDALGAAGLAEAFAHQEMPACVLLAKAELNGFRISPAERQQLEARVLGLMRYLEDRICALAGRRVALTDTSDLAELLFHQLRLPRCDLGDALGLGLDRQQQQQQGSRHQRHRRHPATDRDALEKLRDLHQIPGLIIDWRRLQCALTRSLQPIRMATCSVGEALKVYCEYDTCTVTGRVVTGLPNLQAVPKSFTVHVGPDYVPPSRWDSIPALGKCIK
ncbi:hypothetical protein BOX15_Mlig016884g1, partial [Macrostomum lignano]